MNTIKKFRNAAMILVMGSLVMTSCNDDDEEVPPAVTDNGVTIEGIPATAEIENLGTLGPVTATVTGLDGLTTLVITKDGQAFETVDLTGNTTATYDFTYTAEAADEDANIVFVFTATDADGDTEAVTHVLSVGEAPATAVTVTTNITSDQNWSNNVVYTLGGRITVEDGATLTIERGTVIKGQAGAGANATALLVARGGKLMAEGTADEPIIFTSVSDEITPEQIQAGDFASPNLSADFAGQWGGVIILGRAPISASNDNGDVSEVQIEGIPTSDPNGLYGGNNSADNSGVITYISIRHGGTNIGSGNEINGLTLGGVGSGTVINNVEIVANQDDGVEWFGGTVNVQNVVVWNCGDDGIDTDQSWAGTLDNFVVIGSTGHAFELDGPEGSMAAGHIIRNGSIKMSYDGRVSEEIINTDANSIVTLENLYFTDIVDGQIINRVDAAGVVYNNIMLDVVPGNLANYVNGAVPTSIVAGGTPQADLSGLGWTWTSQAGAMSGL